MLLLFTWFWRYAAFMLALYLLFYVSLEVFTSVFWIEILAKPLLATLVFLGFALILMLIFNPFLPRILNGSLIKCHQHNVGSFLSKALFVVAAFTLSFQALNIKVLYKTFRSKADTVAIENNPNDQQSV